MPSALEIAISRFRAAALNEEMAATRRLIQAYQPARERLVQSIDELVKALQAKGELTAGEIARFDRAIALSEQVEAEIGRLSLTAHQQIIATQEQMVAMASDQARALALVQVPSSQIASIAALWNKVPTTAVEQLVGRLSDGSPLDSLLRKLPTETSSAITETLQDGIARGLNPRAMAAALEQTTDLSSVRLLAITRTETLGAYRGATLATYAENADILSGWVWVCALDNSCVTCVSLHGQEFPIDQTFFEAHVNCRCSPAGLVKGVASPIDANAGQDFFSKLEPEQQDAAIGSKAGGEAYRAGKVTTGDFVTLKQDDKWGNSYQVDSLKSALSRAEERTT